MFNKLKNAVDKTTRNVKSGIAYNTMTSYVYVGKQKVNECKTAGKNKVDEYKKYAKDHPVAATAKVANVATTKLNPASIIKHAAVDCMIDAVVEKKKTSTLKTVLIVLGVLAAIAAIVAVVLYFRKKKNNKLIEETVEDLIDEKLSEEDIIEVIE